MSYKLSPSDLTFLYEDCKRCFYLKLIHNISRPSTPLPSIFTQITLLLKNYYDGRSGRDLHLNLESGVVKYGEKYVRSKSIYLPHHNIKCFISGRFDIVIEFDDKTYGIIDFKTGNPNGNYYSLYGRQLHAYAYALENAAPGALSLFPITKMGLLYFHPSKVSQNCIDWLSYEAEIQWIEIDKDEQDFLKFIDEVLEVLESPTPPHSSPNCQWCGYLNRFKIAREIKRQYSK